MAQGVLAEPLGRDGNVVPPALQVDGLEVDHPHAVLLAEGQDFLNCLCHSVTSIFTYSAPRPVGKRDAASIVAHEKTEVKRAVHDSPFPTIPADHFCAKLKMAARLGKIIPPPLPDLPTLCCYPSERG